MSNKYKNSFEKSRFMASTDENFTIEFRRKLESLYTQEQLDKILGDFKKSLLGKVGSKEFEDLSTSLKSLINNRVVKQNGKGLSTNDFTNELKLKLEGLSAGGASDSFRTELSRLSKELLDLRYPVLFNTFGDFFTNQLLPSVLHSEGTADGSQPPFYHQLSQLGRTVLISNDDLCTVTIHPEAGFSASYQKAGAGDVRFVLPKNSRYRLVLVDGVDTITGNKGGTATVTVSHSLYNDVFLRISNAV